MTAQEIMREKKRAEEIENRMKDAEINYQRSLDNLEKNVRIKMRAFSEKWHHELGKSDCELRNREKEMVVLVQKIQALEVEKRKSQQLL